MDITNIIISTISATGLSGIFLYFLNKRKEIEFRIREQKEKRYKSCLLYMDAYFEPANIKYLSSRQPDIDDANDVLEYLQMEYHDMILYASKEVILSVKSFIDSPSREHFLSAILAMRKDLWVKKRDLNIENLKLNSLSVKVKE
jgi:hypothetical protein